MPVQWLNNTLIDNLIHGELFDNEKNVIRLTKHREVKL